ncbi:MULTISPECIES: hypothetical protein [unclassified Geodermatophilus]
MTGSPMVITRLRGAVVLLATTLLTIGFVAPTASAAPPTRSDVESPARRLVEQAIDPGDYVCGPTSLDAYFEELLGELTESELEFLVTTEALDIPTYDALLFGTASDPEYALEGQARQLQNTFRDLRRFWDIDSSDIQLLAMHGDVLLDVDRVARVLVVVFGYTEAAAAERAQYIADTVASVPAFQGGDNPIFTLNAFAFSGEGESDPLFASIPDKIIMGDGVIDFLEAIGIGDVGPRLVLAHEFGHHIQFELGLFDSPLTGAEATRRTELMADAYATYYAVHARGLALNTRRVLQAEQTFYEVGDCFFDDPGHHGTPQQRMRASAWAAALANDARPQGAILSAEAFAALFDAELPELVAPDA